MDANNLYGWAILQNLPADNVKWLKKTFCFHNDFIKDYNEDSGEGYFLKVDVQYHENLHNFHSYLPLLLEIMNNLPTCMIKEEYIRPNKN